MWIGEFAYNFLRCVRGTQWHVSHYLFIYSVIWRKNVFFKRTETLIWVIQLFALIEKSISLTEKYEEEIGSSRVDTILKSEMWVDVIWKRRNKITKEHLYGFINPVLVVSFRQHFIFAYIWCYNLREKNKKVSNQENIRIVKILRW
jgi:hypothetical protein